MRRILWLKETIGLFDDPYRSLDPAREADTSHLAAHDALSRDAARRSIVLLNNRDNVLPLQKTGQKIALIGPFVQDRENIEGCWTLFGDKQRYVDLETGVRAAIGDSAAGNRAGLRTGSRDSWRHRSRCGCRTAC